MNTLIRYRGFTIDSNEDEKIVKILNDSGAVVMSYINEIVGAWSEMKAKRYIDSLFDTEDLKQVEDSNRKDEYEYFKEKLNEFFDSQYQGNSQITLTKTSNGIVADFKNGDFNDSNVYEQIETNSPEEDFGHYCKLFWDIMDYFGDGLNRKDREKNMHIRYGKDIYEELYVLFEKIIKKKKLKLDLDKLMAEIYKITE